MLYSNIIKPMLFRLDPERAHDLTIGAVAALGEVPGAGAAIAALTASPDPALHTRLFGLDFASPLGLAAGLDKNARAVSTFGALGFGFLEVGTVTPRPQAGNPTPRLFRLPADLALINRMGFNNAGAQAMAARLSRPRSRRVPVAVNIGKNKDTPNEEAEADYRACVRALYPHADFFVVNVSSPNTPGLRALQAGGDLQRLLDAVLAEVDAQRVRHLGPHRPVLVKVAPDLDPDGLAQSLQAAQDSGVAGVIISNTTLSREGLTETHREQPGGLSGRPLRERTTDLIRDAYRLTKGELPIVGVGGIFSARDAYDKIRAGASLIEMYTALIYEGPTLPARINRGLTQLLNADGYSSISEAVGADHR